MDRVTGAIYPPGSTLKPIVYAIAAGEGVIGVNQSFECKGHLLEDDKDSLRCWGWRPKENSTYMHGVLGPSDAIKHSCNIYFYSCARQLGANRLVAGLYGWGYGQRPGVGVAGFLPSLEGGNSAGRGLNLLNATLMGIGQGPISVTPVQVAAAHAGLARGGNYLSPVLMKHSVDGQINRKLNISQRVIDNVLDGMYASANESGGTGYRIKYQDGVIEETLSVDGVVCRVKTGTAQTAVPRIIDFNRNGEIDEGESFNGNHSWYVCHVQRPNDRIGSYVVVVIVEYGGSGGRVAGPIVNQILYAMRAEGYL